MVSARSQRALERSIRRFIHLFIAITTFPSGSFDVEAFQIVGQAQLEPLSFFAASMPSAAARPSNRENLDFFYLITRGFNEKRTIFVKILLQNPKFSAAYPAISVDSNFVLTYELVRFWFEMDTSSVIGRGQI